MEGIARAARARRRRTGEIGLFIHGTTLATNAMIERKGAVTALIATEGFRDILEIADEGRYDQYDIFIDKPDAAGAAHLPLHRAGAHRRRTARCSARSTRRPCERSLPELDAAGVESVAVALAAQLRQCRP